MTEVDATERKGKAEIATHLQRQQAHIENIRLTEVSNGEMLLWGGTIKYALSESDINFCWRSSFHMDGFFWLRWRLSWYINVSRCALIEKEDDGETLSA